MIAISTGMKKHNSSQSLSSGPKLNRRPSSFANDESRKVSFRRGGQVGQDGAAVIAYLENNPETQELYCEEILGPVYLGPLHRMLVQNHSFLHLHSVELPNNGLTVESCEDLANIFHSQQQTLTKLDLSFNPLTAAGVANVMEPLMLESSPCKLRYLNLKNTQLGPKGSTTIASILRYQGSLQELYIGGNQMGSKGMKAIAAVLTHNTTLQIIDVSYNSIKKQGATFIVDALMDAAESGLVKIDLTCNKIGPAGAQALAKLLSVNRTLEAVYVCRNEIGPEGASSFHSALKVNYVLKELRLGANNIGDIGAIMLVESLAENEHRTSAMEKLVLCHNDIGFEGARSLSGVLKENSKLCHIDLTGNRLCGASAQKLAEALSYNLELKELLLNSNRIDDEGAFSLALSMGRSSCTLTNLTCQNNSMSSEGYLSLARVPQLRRNQKYWLEQLVRDLSKAQVSSVHLTERNIGDEELLLLIDVLESALPIVRAFYISGASLTRRSLKPFCGRAFGSMSNIVRLYLSSSDCGDEIAESLARALKNNISLQVLSLTDSLVTTTGAAAISDGISCNTTLRRLNLDRNAIGDAGMHAFGQSIPQSSLQSFSVCWNSLTDASMDFEAVCGLQELHLNGNKISDRGALSLCRVLIESPNLIWLSLRHTDITNRGRNAIASVIASTTNLEC